MKINIGEGYFVHEYENVSVKSIPTYLADRLDWNPEKIEEFRCCFQFSKINTFDIKNVCNILRERLVDGGTVLIEDINFFKVANDYYWSKITIDQVNADLGGSCSYLDPELVRSFFPELKLIRSEISTDTNRFLLEFKKG